MGRASPSHALPSSSARKAARSRQAKETLNKTIPALLLSNPRASLGVASAELISNTKPLPPLEDHEAPPPRPKISVLHTDTITAATQLHKTGKKDDRIAILNMASPLRPGGGFLTGASSQEEFLCMQTTLLPSLREDFYRLPELGAVFTPDVLVFRNASGEDLAKKEQFYVDVVTAGMLRFPDVEGGEYVCGRDWEVVLEKMRAVLRVLVGRGVGRVVLGAWGCGAYGNPVGRVARAWRGVLGGSRRRDRDWKGLREVVFAITDERMVDVFKTTFEDVVEEEASLENKEGVKVEKYGEDHDVSDLVKDETPLVE